MLKRWVPASIISVAMALALAGGAALAFGTGNDSHRTDVFERAAEILGISSSELQSAHDQAKREERDAHIATIVEQLVAGEVIDQAEADSFTAWNADRPDAANEALFSQLTGSVFGTIPFRGKKTNTHRFPHESSDKHTDRMAEILGIDPLSLADALKDGEAELAEKTRLERVHTAIDDQLENAAITANDATELHSWVDATPQWLLDLDLSERMLKGFGLFSGKRGESDWLKRLPYGPDHFGKGDRDFRFEFRGPKGHFEFGPDDKDFPFGQHGLKDLFEQFDLEKFEYLENLDDLKGLFDRFEGFRYFEHPFELPEETTETPDNEAASA
jgi:hypothetical protein